MSVESWIREYYPVIAGNVPKESALAHSYTKWCGLLPENLCKHDVTVIDNKVGYIGIDSSSCALCKHYLCPACSGCPLASIDAASNFNSCDAEYEIWCMEQDPQPMIEKISAAIKKSQG